ncbi:hypothetical protein PULV_a2016 [Pseudoalteromonas ulvae UL12]|uniref:OmpA-like domain-containing protein n=1 Tax=Pseudoalteromonas ulvae TaxID=107327 RepID=A0A244CQE0_PSEDV|nr:sortase-associated OmpA-like protein PdsO [Pseudoalteromonas ulvae]MBE0365252.1 hypothetical protein [Pseudoalteromonas ulvae UL12]OUL57788.1 hypothetical protein B1199_12095 [Pseudoalteromonas ulvae]
MKKSIIAFTLITLFSAPVMVNAQTEQVTAKKTMNTEQAIGMGSGALLGAAVGGPIGAFIGALTGGLIGQNESDKKVIQAQNQLVAKQQGELVALEHKAHNYQKLVAQNEQLEDRLTDIEAEKSRLQQQQIDNLMAMTVQFRTGSSSIEAHFASQLDALAELLQQSPEIALDLHGFADQRGDEDANLKLSQARVTNVKAYLIKQGVPSSRLNSDAFGELHANASKHDFEGDFFDRKVTVKARKQPDITATAQHQSF